MCADSLISVTTGGVCTSASLPVAESSNSESDITDLLMKDKDDSDNQNAPVWLNQFASNSLVPYFEKVCLE